MKKFIEFLERNNAWGKFERAFEEQNRDVEEYKRMCKVFASIEIDHAFEWSKTKEGINYWEKLNKKWIDENRSLKQKLLSDD